MGETSRGDVSVVEDASLVWSEAPVLVPPHLKEAPFVKSYGDVVMDGTTPNIGLIEPICNEPLDLTPTSSPLLPTTLSHLHTYYESLGDIRGYNPSLIHIVHT